MKRVMMEGPVGLYILLANLACALANVGLDLRVVPSVVDPARTKNVTLSCVATQYDEVQSISSLRIFKYYESGWGIVAQITDLEPNTVYIKDQSITSQAGSMGIEGNVVGRMSISWSPSSSSTLGQFKCLASRYTTDQNQIYTKYTTISLGSQLDALAILRVMKSDKDEVMDKLEELTEKAEQFQQQMKESTDEDLSTLRDIVLNLESELNNTLADEDSNLRQVEEKLLNFLKTSTTAQANRLENLNRRVETSLGRGFLLLWPRGTYVLPSPNTGCPNSAGVNWAVGWRKQHTQSVDRNTDEVSEGSHLFPPIRSIDSDQNNFVYQHFCVNSDSTSPGPTWPKGTYCIGKKGACPRPFANGSIIWDEQKSGGLSTWTGALQDGQFSAIKTRLEYCCRDDGPANEPVDLPRSQPFYLYRYGGQCQQVAGMIAREEFVRFDTQNNDNGDEASGAHPDVTLNDVVLQLCYYEQA